MVALNNITVADLFAGCGGTSEGATRAGMRVVVAANHWPAAVAVHRANHPGTEHFTQDLQQADFHKWPDFDGLLASPACVGHAWARGKDRPHHDPARSTAWAVVACAEAKQPKIVVIENVPEFLRWQLYPHWKSCLQSLGYTLAETILDAADVGVPQHRRRLFIVGVHNAVSTAPVFIPPGREAHRPALDILDPHAEGWSPVRQPGRAEATLRRIENGRRQHGRRFLLAYYGSERGGRSLARPIGTISTRDRYALVDGDRMRMLRAHEYLRAQGFPARYRLTGHHKTDLVLLGNAVPPPLAQHVLTAVQDHLR
jgi:DNA (cytosine-5)-methyltransferase 1